MSCNKRTFLTRSDAMKSKKRLSRQFDMPKHIANRRETIAGRNDAARPLLGEI